jgi:hypothetical protein
MNKSLKLFLVSLAVLTVVGGGLYLAFKKDWIHLGDRKNAASTENLDDETDEYDSWVVPCESSAESVVVSVPSSYISRVYVAEIPEDYLSYSFLESSDRRTFSISEFQNVPDEEPAYSAFVHFQTADDSNTTGIDVETQLCDENNMTNHTLQVDESGIAGERSGIDGYLHGSQHYIPDKPGNYRFDGYAYYNGEWHLVGQIDLVFTE